MAQADICGAVSGVIGGGLEGAFLLVKLSVAASDQRLPNVLNSDRIIAS